MMFVEGKSYGEPEWWYEHWPSWRYYGSAPLVIPQYLAPIEFYYVVLPQPKVGK
jgi:hypothetical protein